LLEVFQIHRHKPSNSPGFITWRQLPQYFTTPLACTWSGTSNNC